MKRTKEIKEALRCPFLSKNKIKFPIRALNDIVFLWKIPESVISEKKLSETIIIPEHIIRKKTSEIGFILSIGPGYWDKKKFYPCTDLKAGDFVAYDSSVPWNMGVKAEDGKEYMVTIAGYKDVRALAELEE